MRPFAEMVWKESGKAHAAAEREKFRSCVEHIRKQHKPTDYDDPEDYHYNLGAFAVLGEVLVAIEAEDGQAQGGRQG